MAEALDGHIWCLQAALKILYGEQVVVDDDSSGTRQQQVYKRASSEECHAQIFLPYFASGMNIDINFINKKIDGLVG